MCRLNVCERGLVVGDVLCCPVGSVEPGVDTVELVADGAAVRAERVADLAG